MRTTEKMCINNDDILHNENGTRIFNNSNRVQLDAIRKNGNYLDDHQEWNLTQIRDIIKIYNSLIESSKLIQMVRYVLSGSVLTLNILNLPKEEIELNNQIVERLKRFKSLVEFISKYHKHKNDFSDKRKNILDIITILTSFKENIDDTSTTHLCVDLYPRTEERDFEIQENQYLDQLFSLIQIQDFLSENKKALLELELQTKTVAVSVNHIQAFQSMFLEIVWFELFIQGMIVWMSEACLSF